MRIICVDTDDRRILFRVIPYIERYISLDIRDVTAFFTDFGRNGGACAVKKSDVRFESFAYHHAYADILSLVNKKLPATY